MMPVRFWPVAPATRGEIADHGSFLNFNSGLESQRVDQSFAGVVKRTSQKSPELQFAVQICALAPQI